MRKMQKELRALKEETLKEITEIEREKRLIMKSEPQIYRPGTQSDTGNS